MPPPQKHKPTAKQSSRKPKSVKAPTASSNNRSGGTALNLLILCVLAAFIWVFQKETVKVNHENSQKFEEAHLAGVNIEEAYPHYDTPPGTPVLNVMFVGNSYTMVNNMPFMVQAVAASDASNPVVINLIIFAKEGATLESLWERPNSLEALASRPWNYVVLQEQSTMASSPDWTEEMHRGIVNWDRSIKKVGSRTMLYGTWARKEGSDWYNRQKYPELNLVSPSVMQQKLDDAYNSFASEIGAGLVPVGDYWAMCEAQPGAPDFYNKDGSHPNFAGDYLISLLFYRALTGHKLDHVTYIAPGLTPEQAKLIRQCASYGS